MEQGPYSVPTALIIGASVAGLLAARALHNNGWHIVILDRDKLPDAALPRKGTPQCHHAHVLLRRGLDAIEQLVPGFEKALSEAGGVPVNATLDWEANFQHGELKRGPSDLNFITASRPLIEHTLRRLVLSGRDIVIHESTHVTHVDLGDQRTPSITTTRGKFTTPQQVALVINACGRNSSGDEWLTKSGYDIPSREVTKPGLGYASCVFRGLNLPQGTQALLTMYRAPDFPSAAIIMPIENETHLVTLSGLQGNYPPDNENEFMEFASSLRTPRVHEYLQYAERISPIKRFRKDTSVFKRYDRMARFPNGFLVAGDALCSFNPIYGQGITAAALAAIKLQKATTNGIPNSKSLQRIVASAYETPWKMASTEDKRWLDNPGLTARLSHHLIDTVAKAATRDAAIARLYLGVLHMVEPVNRLLFPHILLRAYWLAYFQRGV